jgi:hypothetical protein
MSFIDYEIVPADEARSQRQRRLIRAQLTDSFGAICDAVIRNVSEKGIGVSGQGVPLLRGSTVTITIPQGMVMSGTVRWIENSAFGIELDSPIDLQTLADVIQRKQKPASQDAHWEVRSLPQVDLGRLDPSKARKI